MQRKQGDWPNYALAGPPLEDGGFTLTARGIRALRVYPFPGRQAEFADRVERAAKWLEGAEPRTMEDRSMRLLGIAWTGHKPPRSRIEELASRQRADGGWGQTDHLAADAYATGEALWALHESGMPASDPVDVRGVSFPLQPQQHDGSWHVATRALRFQPYFESGFPHGHDRWISLIADFSPFGLVAWEACTNRAFVSGSFWTPEWLIESVGSDAVGCRATARPPRSSSRRI